MTSNYCWLEFLWTLVGKSIHMMLCTVFPLPSRLNLGNQFGASCITEMSNQTEYLNRTINQEALKR
jgi:hypothetical protein